MYSPDPPEGDPKATLFSEAMVNLVGSDHIQSGDTKGGVEIMKLSVGRFLSESPNVYDSLSDAANTFLPSG